MEEEVVTAQRVPFCNAGFGARRRPERVYHDFMNFINFVYIHSALIATIGRNSREKR